DAWWRHWSRWCWPQRNGAALRDGTVLCAPHKSCPQATMQALASGVAALGMPRLWCEQAMPECGPTGHSASSGSV
ncbi:hypothetical protein NDU88_005914, partial [Pleurodeles waltl]